MLPGDVIDYAIEAEAPLQAPVPRPAGASAVIAGQAEQIISQVAHPSVREELRQAGRELGLGV